jgi:hypothetical protein
MIKLHSKAQPPSRGRRLLWLFALLALVVVGLMFIERGGGRRRLAIWKAQMEAEGEKLDPKRLWPPASPRNVEFSNRLAQVLRQLPTGLANYAGQLSAIVQNQPGQGRRGSQERKPWRSQPGTATYSWTDLEDQLGKAQPALDTLRQLMEDPPPDMGYDIMEQLGKDNLPNLVNVRRGAQTLHAAAMNDLHHGNLAGALENLTALSGFVKLYADDPNLVNFMIRVAISGLSVDVCWDALQARDWTEPQLAALQQACQNDNLLLVQMSRCLEAERATRLQELAWFRGHSYDAWVARYQPILQSFNLRPSDRASGPVRCWRQWVFHPLWSFAWADEEELAYLRTVQGEIMILREAARYGNWPRLRREMAVHCQDYSPPIAAWRLYSTLPFLDQFSEIIGTSKASPSTYPYPQFSKAWSITMKNLTLHQMVIAAVALKRYELRHGQVPQGLGSLTPELLAEPPRDFMDGQPLRYQVDGNGSYTLYSVGEDGRDDGGNPLPAISEKNPQNASPWSGRDWVWPKAVAGVNPSEIKK